MKKIVILCVDDEQIILSGLKKQLKNELGDGYMIETAESGKEAIEVFEELQDDGYYIPVVISDYIMPGMKGDELLEYIFKIAPKTVNILLTGQAGIEAISNAVNKANLYRYISKPWDQGDLALTIKEALKRREQEERIEIQNKELAELNKELENKVIVRTKQLEQANEELKQTLDVINEQKNEIETKSEHITQSINYASRIQRAVLPDDKQLSGILKDFFVYFAPRDIVSGDFYKTSIHGDTLVFAVADCTGHGVPGAIMSMLGISYLTEILSAAKPLDPASVLNCLRGMVKNSLNQTGERGESKDGMDIAICMINKNTLELEFSAANASMILIRENSLPEVDCDKCRKFQTSEYNCYQIKTDSQPIGIHHKETPFSKFKTKLYPSDKLYMFSDGYIDQIGGAHERKFMIQNFRDMLLEITHLDFATQKKLLIEKLDNWKSKKFGQTDDIIVTGFSPVFNIK